MLRRAATDRVPTLGVVHGLRALGRAAATRAAELAHERAVPEAMHVLADKWRAPAVVTLGPPGLESHDALAQQLALEIGL